MDCPLRRTERCVQLQIVDLDDWSLDLVSTAHQGAEPGQQLFQLERLGKVVIGAEIEAPDLVLNAAPRRQDQHMRAQSFLTPFFEQRQTVLFGEHEVENDDVVLRGLGLEVALLAIVSNIDGEVLFLQALLECSYKRAMVFNEENTHADL
jgi:hypothetical protein